MRWQKEHWLGLIFILLVFQFSLLFLYFWQPPIVAVSQLSSQQLTKPTSLRENLQNINLSAFIKTISNMTQPTVKPYKIIFVGDTMLDRGVESLMKKKGFDYPFVQIKELFALYDLAIINLEGPIVANPPDNGPTSLKFAFDPQVIAVLRESQIKVVSLANNHTLNMGKEGLNETRRLLDENKIRQIGDPISCTDEYVYQDKQVVMLAFNKTFSYCQDQDIIQVVTRVRAAEPTKLIILSMHWGSEYKTVNSANQQKLARQLIDAGVDLIIGHHPHVVQNVEIYKNKLIFYSLGNFVFDQYFSNNTQQGLAVGLEIYDKKIVYTLFPLSINFSQPYVMNRENANKFLAGLGKRSGSQLEENIKNGIIGITR